MTWKLRRTNPWGKLCHISLASIVVILGLAANSNWSGQAGHFPNDLVTCCDKQQRNVHLMGHARTPAKIYQTFFAKRKEPLVLSLKLVICCVFFFLSATTVRLQSFFRFLFFMGFWSPHNEHGGWQVLFCTQFLLGVPPRPGTFQLLRLGVSYTAQRTDNQIPRNSRRKQFRCSLASGPVYLMLRAEGGSRSTALDCLEKHTFSTADALRSESQQS